MSDFKDKLDTAFTVAGVVSSMLDPMSYDVQSQYADHYQQQVQQQMSQTDTGRQNPYTSGK